MKLIKKFQYGGLNDLNLLLLNNTWKNNPIGELVAIENALGTLEFIKSLQDYAKREQDYINAYKNWDYVPIKGEYPIMTNIAISDEENIPIYRIPGNVMAKAFPNYVWNDNQTWEPDATYYAVRNADGLYASIPGSSYLSLLIDAWKLKVSDWNTQHSTPYYEQRFNPNIDSDALLQALYQYQHPQPTPPVFPELAQLYLDNRTNYEHLLAQNRFNQNIQINEYNKQKALEDKIRDMMFRPVMPSNYIRATGDALTGLDGWLDSFFDPDKHGIWFTELGKNFLKYHPYMAAFIDLGADALGGKVVPKIGKAIPKVKRVFNRTKASPEQIKETINELGRGTNVEDLDPILKNVAKDYDITTESLPEGFAETFQKQVLDRIPKNDNLFEHHIVGSPGRISNYLTARNRRNYKDFINNLKNGNYIAISDKAMRGLGEGKFLGYFDPVTKKVVIVKGNEAFEINLHEFRHMLDDLGLNLPQEQIDILNAAYDEDFLNLANDETSSLYLYPHMGKERVTTNLDSRIALLKILYERGAIKNKNVRSLLDVYKLPVEEQNMLIDSASDSDIVRAVQYSNGYGYNYINYILNKAGYGLDVKALKNQKKYRPFRSSAKLKGEHGTGVSEAKIKLFREAMKKVGIATGVTYGVGATMQL